MMIVERRSEECHAWLEQTARIRIRAIREGDEGFRMGRMWTDREGGRREARFTRM
jgi:hypothetical protein